MASPVFVVRPAGRTRPGDNRMSNYTSAERVCAAITGETVDYIPLCFEGICHGVLPLLRRKLPDPFERARFYVSEGIDTAVSLQPPATSARSCSTREWTENPEGARYPIMHKTYQTPAGTLEQVVHRTEDYPTAIKLWGDHNVPASRSLKYLVSRESDLPVLEHILAFPLEDELSDFRARAEAARRFCDAEGIMLSGMLHGIGDPLMWMSGVENVLFAGLENPSFLQRYIDVVRRLEMKRLELLIDFGVDLVVRRGWYESTDFWSPSLFRRFLYEPLAEEVHTAHQANVLYVYVMNSGYADLLEMLAELGIDMLSNVDPVTGKLPLDSLKDGVNGRFALCGGVNNFEVIERGTEDQVRAAVRGAVRTLSPGGKFILAPGDSILSTSDTAERNFRAMIDEWRKLRGG